MTCARCADLDKILTDRFRRTVKAEETLMAAALGKRPPLTLDECRDLANLIGKPELTHSGDSRVRAEIGEPRSSYVAEQLDLRAREFRALKRTDYVEFDARLDQVASVALGEAEAIIRGFMACSEIDVEACDKDPETLALETRVLKFLNGGAVDSGSKVEEAS